MERQWPDRLGLGAWIESGPVLRPDGNPIRDRGTGELIHWPGLDLVAGQVAVLRIPRKPPPPFEELADAPCQGLGQPG